MRTTISRSVLFALIQAVYMTCPTHQVLLFLIRPILRNSLHGRSTHRIRPTHRDTELGLAQASVSSPLEPIRTSAEIVQKISRRITHARALITIPALSVKPLHPSETLNHLHLHHPFHRTSIVQCCPQVLAVTEGHYQRIKCY